MPIIKCKMCGGDVQLAEDKTFGTCEYCGSTMTFPKVSDEQRAAAFNRGNHFRRIGEFDKALAVYERIVAEDDTDAEAHWCCALCRFGIEYVEDPATYEWLPTCHRASFDSFLEDVDYLAAVEHSDGITRRQYQKDAAKIAEVQRGILATSQSAEPYDVFISYKELDADGNRTRDSILAQEIYYRLTEKGWRVFFSRISLEDVPGTQYEPYIFAALNSAKVMIVVGTSAENLSAVWVKNEWSRYLSIMRKDRSKLLIPCYRDMDPYDLPEQLAVLMSYDMGKIGFIQDLIRGVDKVLNAEKPKENAAPAPVQERVIVQQSTGGPNVTALIKRGQQALEDGEWDKARGFYDQVLSMDAENAEAFIGLALAESRTRDLQAYIDDLCSGKVNIETDTLERDNAHIESSIEKYIVPDYLDRPKLAALYNFDVSYPVKLRGETAVTQQIKSRFNGDRNLNRAFRYAQGKTKQKLEAAKKSLYDTLDERARVAEAADKKAVEEAKADYAAKLEAADRKAEELSRTAQGKREEDYQEAQELLTRARTKEDYWRARSGFSQLRDYKDARQQLEECENRLQQIREQETVAKNRAKEAQNKKKRTIKTIMYIAAAAIIFFIIIAVTILIPGKKYRAASQLAMNGQYEEAIEAFDALGNFKDSKEQATEMRYCYAISLLDSQIIADNTVAYELFTALGSYKESEQYRSGFICLLLNEEQKSKSDYYNWKYSYTYDENGRLIQRNGSNHYWDYISGTTKEHYETEVADYYYRSDNSLEKILRTEDDSAYDWDQSTITELYNTEGWIISKSWDSGLNYSYSYEMKNGIVWKQTKISSLYGDTTVQEFDAHGVIVDYYYSHEKSKKSDTSYTKHRTYLNQYNDEELLAFVTVKDDDGEILWTEEYQYDSEGNLTQVDLISNKIAYSSYSTTYSYGYIYMG